ncbi:unnamed protein product [Prunus brigantina]
MCWWSMMELPNCASNTRRRLIRWTKCFGITMVWCWSCYPNNENCLYLNIGGDIVSCNIITRKWSKVASFESGINVNSYFYPFVLPWWPTPVPRLPQPIA